MEYLEIKHLHLQLVSMVILRNKIYTSSVKYGKIKEKPINLSEGSKSFSLIIRISLTQLIYTGDVSWLIN